MAKQEGQLVKPTAATTRQGEVIPLVGGKVMTVQEFDAWLREANEAKVEPDVDPYMRILRQVLSATTPDEVLTPIEAIQARNLVGHALICQGFTLNESEYDVGSPMYAALHCVYIGLLPSQELELLNIKEPSPPLAQQPGQPQVEAGDEIVVTCGHKKVITQVVTLERLNAWPRNVVFVQRGRSKISGSPMLTLLKWGSEPANETG